VTLWAPSNGVVEIEPVEQLALRARLLADYRRLHRYKQRNQLSPNNAWSFATKWRFPAAQLVGGKCPLSGAFPLVARNVFVGDILPDWPTVAMLQDRAESLRLREARSEEET
jgi:hypothetical protein